MKLTIATFLTLDGVMQSPGAPEEDPSNGFELGGWLPPFADNDMDTIIRHQWENAEAFLIGRTTYELFGAFWPNVTDPEDVVATKLRQKPKYVVSDTLDKLEWWSENTQIIRGSELLDEIKRLKSEGEGELQVHGSAGLAQTLINNGLIDEYRLWIYPVVVGKGKRLFEPGTAPSGFERIDTQITSTGVTVQTYKYTGKPSYGTVDIEDGRDVVR